MCIYIYIYLDISLFTAYIEEGSFCCFMYLHSTYTLTAHLAFKFFPKAVYDFEVCQSVEHEESAPSDGGTVH